MAFNGRFILNVADFSAKLGADFQTLIQESGETEEALRAADCTVSRAAYSKVVDKAVALTGDPYLGLHLGEGLGLTAAGLIGQITQTSRTVKEALEYCCEFANLGCSELPLTMQRHGDYYRVGIQQNLIWAAESPQAYRHTAEGVLVFTLRECQALTHGPQRPIEIHLPWNLPTNTAEYERVFGTSVRFKQNRFAILLHRSQVEVPTVSADYKLLRILVAHAEERSRAFQRKQGFTAVVRQSMIQLVKPDFPSVEQVAQHLNVSVRTLQRRLSEDGITFKALVDEVRKEFAMTYLRKEELSIGEVAYLLGYADGSVFSRACKRWFGESPQQWRNDHLNS